MKTTYAYDALDRPATATYADGKVVTWQYDQGANGIGHLTHMTDRSGSTAWTYDRHGRVLTKKTTAAGMTFTTATAYDAAGRLASIAYPSGAVVALSYDAAGRVSGLKAGATALASGVALSAVRPGRGLDPGQRRPLQPQLRPGRPHRQDRVRRRRDDAQLRQGEPDHRHRRDRACGQELRLRRARAASRATPPAPPR